MTEIISTHFVYIKKTSATLFIWQNYFVNFGFHSFNHIEDFFAHIFFFQSFPVFQ